MAPTRQTNTPRSKPGGGVARPLVGCGAPYPANGSKTGQPIHRDRRLPRPVRGFEEGRAYRFFLTASCTRLQQVDRLRLETVNQLPQGICLR